jgi:hypothetical protein
VLVATGLSVLTLSLLCTPARGIRLGGPDATPEVSVADWFAMLFAAGMCVGLVNFGVAEPVMHLGNPLMAEPNTDAAAREAMRLSFSHRGLHAWAIYIVLALAIAHGHFNRGLPLAPRSALEPLIGERYKGPIGDIVDILCTVGTLLGVATSLRLGAMQINSSLALFFGASKGVSTQVLLIIGISIVATISVVLGVKKGVQRLSQLMPRECENLSDGEMQMVAISRALLGSPGLVLFDEPSQGLTPKIVQDVMKTIRRLKDEGVAALIVEQNTLAALDVADRVYVMDRGRILHEGPAATLRDDAALREKLLGL